MLNDVRRSEFTFLSIRLMEKCEKITHKMETMVEDLTNGNKSRMELTEQPRSLNKDFKLTGYQMIG